ncbi:MAG: PilX N-terminal domain-containing pilus assembly protein [Sporomusa sp.]
MCSFYPRTTKQSGASSLFVITAVLIVLLLALLGSSFSLLSSTELNMAVNYRDGIAALYLAEAGAKRALVELSYNLEWKPSNPYYEGNGHYSLDLAALPTMIVATGTVNKAVRKVVLKVTIASDLESSIQKITINSWNYF